MKVLVCSLFSLWLAFITSNCQSQTATNTTTTETVISRAELDQMLAPIALYPDTVLSHILIAATYPLEVVQADRWAQANQRLTAEDAVNAVDLEEWDPSVKALVAFPDILRRMSDDLNWTQRLGDAFLADESRVMDAIQNLRDKAYASGNLRDTQYTKVVREEKVIVIEPAVERVVYIPYYDTRVVYGSWWWHGYPPVYWHHPVSYVHIGGFYWGPRTYLSTGFFFSSPHWHQRRVVVIDYHDHHHPRYYSGHKIAHYHGAHHWQHNPRHRHNVAYRHEHVRHKFDNHNHHRADSGRFERDWRPDHGKGTQHRGSDRNERQAHNNHQNSDGRQNSNDHDRQAGNRGQNHRNQQPDATQGHNRDNRAPVSVGHRFENGQRRDGNPDNRQAGEQNRDRSRQDGAPRADQVRERLGQQEGRERNNNGPENRTSERTGETQRGRDSQTQNLAEWQQRQQHNQHRSDMDDRREHLQRVQPQNPQRTERREQPAQQQERNAPEQRSWPQQQQHQERQPREERQQQQEQLRQEPEQQRQESRNQWVQRGDRDSRNTESRAQPQRQEQGQRNQHSQSRGERRFER
jgi:hypothetical protein